MLRLQSALSIESAILLMQRGNQMQMSALEPETLLLNLSFDTMLEISLPKT